jgi:ABC-type Zn uptake system ZnuABC Zn-binding protein ZnuA
MRALLLPLAAVLIVTAAVGLAFGEDPGAAGGPRVRLVATTTQVASIARAVAGDRARVTGLLAPNADPHGYEVRPGDVRAVADAQVVVRSGGEVDRWLGAAIRAGGRDGDVLDLSRHVHLHGDDPHWWQDPRNGAAAALAIGRALAHADPAHAAAYARAARAYARTLTTLDGAIVRCWSAVPRAQRRLVTTHDAYGYYARRYGLTFAGAVVPSLSTRAQPSPRALARLVDDIRRERIRAIFTERALNPRVERAVADEAGVRVGRALTGDALARGETYPQALVADTRALVDGLAGRRVACTF